MGRNPLNRSLEQIISLALGESRPNGSVKSSIVSLHLSQMREWGVRGGNIQFKSIQDYNNIRKGFISDLMSDNYIKSTLESSMNHLVARGEIMWLAKPSNGIKSGYSIEYFAGGRENPNPDYHVFHKDDNPTEVECVVVQQKFDTNKTTHYVDQPSAFLNMGLFNNFKWVITFIDNSSYISWTFNQKPESLRSTYYWYASFKGLPGYNVMTMASHSPTVIPNPFAPEFPFVICKNNASKRTDIGLDDFTPLKDSIEDHNDLLRGVGKNLKVFYTPTLVTSREALSVLDMSENYGSSVGRSSTWASQNGFYGTHSSDDDDDDEFRMPSVVGNIKEGERFGYVQVPDVVSGDHNLYIRSLRELIHWTLGGVDPLGISASATFGEIKSLFGRIENTAFRKADIILGDKGLCKLLVLILVAEENKARVAITKFVLYQYLNGDLTAESIVRNTMTDEIFRDLYFYITEELGLKLPGLPPLGEQGCSWRYTKDVFERTTRDQLDASIVYRNAREDGISQDIALAQLYPNMKDDEIRDSMSGFSPRVVNNAMAGISSLLQLHAQLMQVPSPENPDIPWGAVLGTSAMVEQGIKTLQKELAWTNPVFRDEVNYDSVNNEINQTLDQIRATLSKNVQPTTSAPTVSGSIPPARREPKPGRQPRSGV